MGQCDPSIAAKEYLNFPATHIPFPEACCKNHLLTFGNVYLTYLSKDPQQFPCTLLWEFFTLWFCKSNHFCHSIQVMLSSETVYADSKTISRRIGSSAMYSLTSLCNTCDNKNVNVELERREVCLNRSSEKLFQTQYF